MVVGEPLPNYGLGNECDLCGNKNKVELLMNIFKTDDIKYCPICGEELEPNFYRYKLLATQNNNSNTYDRRTINQKLKEMDERLKEAERIYNKLKEL